MAPCLVPLSNTPRARNPALPLTLPLKHRHKPLSASNSCQILRLKKKVRNKSRGSAQHQHQLLPLPLPPRVRSSQQKTRRLLGRDGAAEGQQLHQPLRGVAGPALTRCHELVGSGCTLPPTMEVDRGAEEYFPFGTPLCTSIIVGKRVRGNAGFSAESARDP